MAWRLGGDQIPIPKGKKITRSSQSVLHRLLNGTFTRDFVGEEKYIIEADYQNISTTYLDIILGHYQTQQSTGATILFEIDELSISVPVIIEISTENYTIEECYTYRKIQITFYEAEPYIVVS